MCVPALIGVRIQQQIQNQKKKQETHKQKPKTICRGSAWVCHKLGNAPILRSGTGSWVLSG